MGSAGRLDCARASLGALATVLLPTPISYYNNKASHIYLHIDRRSTWLNSSIDAYYLETDVHIDGHDSLGHSEHD